jgi:hypothetical protein
MGSLICLLAHSFISSLSVNKDLEHYTLAECSGSRDALRYTLCFKEVIGHEYPIACLANCAIYSSQDLRACCPRPTKYEHRDTKKASWDPATVLYTEIDNVVHGAFARQFTDSSYHIVRETMRCLSNEMQIDCLKDVVLMKDGKTVLWAAIHGDPQRTCSLGRGTQLVGTFINIRHHHIEKLVG